MNLLEKLVPFRSGNKWGFSNLEKKSLFPAYTAGCNLSTRDMQKSHWNIKRLGY